MNKKIIKALGEVLDWIKNEVINVSSTHDKRELIKCFSDLINAYIYFDKLYHENETIIAIKPPYDKKDEKDFLDEVVQRAEEYYKNKDN